MADAWKCGHGRERPETLYPYAGKRPRLSFDTPSVSDASGFYARESDGAGFGVARTTNSIIPLFERMSPGFGAHHHAVDPRAMAIGGSDPTLVATGPPIGIGGWRQIPLPPDASPTLFVEGIPATCSRREVSHIFRPFLGYKDVRLVTKEIRHSWVERLVLCFVDFESPAQAAIAMDALQGYKFDKHDRDSANLRIEFARHSGARVGGGDRGKH